MKKILKTFSINVILIIITIIIVDIVYAHNEYCKDVEGIKKRSYTIGFKEEEYTNIPPFRYSLRQYTFEHYYRNKSKNFESLRWVCRAENSKKGSVIIFGDSFGEGAWLNDDEIFSSQLSKLTNRTVYNRSFAGTGPAALVFQTKSQILYDSIDTIPEYAIYIFIPNHFFRTYWGKYGSANTSNIPYVGYKEKDGFLEEDYSFIHNINRLTFLRRFVEQSQVDYICKNPDIAFDFVMLHFIEAKRELQKRYPNIKLIILKHPQFPNVKYVDTTLYKSPRWDILKKEDILVYNLEKDLNINVHDKEYNLPDMHPSAKLWEVVSKKLQKDLNL